MNKDQSACAIHFAASRETPQLQANPNGLAGIPRDAAGQISGWKARATKNAAASVKIRVNPWPKKRRGTPPAFA